MPRTDAIHVVGAGGIGCAVSYALLTAGQAVTVVETNPDKIAAGDRAGVQVVGRPTLAASFISFAEWSPPDRALILLCTKCYDNSTVLDRLSPNAELLPIQNGFDSLLDSRSHSAEGIASFVSECEPDRPITRITRPGDLHVGGRGGPPPEWLPQLASQLRAGRLFRVIETPDVRPYKFAKLMYNAAISPLAAATGIDNGKLLSDARARRLFFALLRENYAILRSAGIPLGTVGPLHPRTVDRLLSARWLARILARFFEPGLRGTYCSMSGDLPRGRTEIANYNEHLVTLADGRTPCPLNSRAVEVVRRMERERIPASPQALDWFE